jgi:8-oxo-dGTP diphosphatase
VLALRVKGKTPHVCLIHRGERQDWSFPKGKLERGEPAPVAAVRETAEEAGLDVILGRRLKSVSYEALGLPKTVDYWVGSVRQESGWEPSREVDEVRWVKFTEAEQMLTYQRDRDLLSQIQIGEKPTQPLILLRHAQAERRQAFRAKFKPVPPPDTVRPLTNQGLRQSNYLQQILHAYGIEDIYSSPATRCIQSVTPFSLKHYRPISVMPALSEEFVEFGPEPAQEVTRTLAKQDRPIVICGHRPLLPFMTRAAANELGVGVPEVSLPPSAYIVFHRAIQGKAISSTSVETGLVHL